MIDLGREKQNGETVQKDDSTRREALKNNYEADKAYRATDVYDIWRATFRLGKQGSFKTDSLVNTVHAPYSYGE